MRLGLFFTICFSLSSAFAETNTTLDFSVALAPEPVLAGFDSEVLFAPNFAFNQSDPALSDIFSPTGQSGLCFPTSLSMVMAYMFGYNQPKYSDLKLSGLSDNNAKLDPNALIHQMFDVCKVDRTNGTFFPYGLACTIDMFKNAGYSAGDTQLISPFHQDPTLPISTRDVTVQDIKSALDRKHPVILEIAWMQYDATAKTWNRLSGHYFAVFGYRYKNAWNNDEIILQILNPVADYGPSRTNAISDFVTVERYHDPTAPPDQSLPPNRDYIVVGGSFGNDTPYAFLGMMMEVGPQQ